MQSVFVHTDISLDLLTQRQPFYTPAATLFTKADKKELKLFVSALSFSNLYYVLNSEHSATESRRILNNFRILVNVLPVTEKIIDLALQSLFKDFEDAIQYYAAIQHNIPVILTRNLNDYKQSAVPVMTAADFLKNN
jgi:predicted nucleic acid-binding protein